MHEYPASTQTPLGNTLPAGQTPDAVDQLPLPYIEMDASGTITRANRAALCLHPAEQGGLVGSMAWELMATDEKEQSCAAYLSFMVSGEDPPPVMRSLYTGGGEFRTCELHRNLIRDSEGRPAGMRLMLVDVTPAKKALEEAQYRSSWLESMIESMADGVIMTDALGFIRVVNPAAEQLFGWKAKELIGKVIEKGLPLLSFASEQGQEKGAELSFTMKLSGPCRGVATILGRLRQEVRVELTTSPILDRETGFTTGVVSLMRPLEQAAIERSGG